MGNQLKGPFCCHRATSTELQPDTTVEISRILLFDTAYVVCMHIGMVFVREMVQITGIVLYFFP